MVIHLSFQYTRPLSPSFCPLSPSFFPFHYISVLATYRNATLQGLLTPDQMLRMSDSDIYCFYLFIF